MGNNKIKVGINANVVCWWDSLTFEQKFYKTIQWLKLQNRDLTEVHPHELTIYEIIEIFNTLK